MGELLQRINMLMEALPYIRKYHKAVFVIKYGGNVLIHQGLRKAVFEDVAFLNFVGMRPILVHGGGPLISERLKEKGKKSKFLDGRRITDANTMKIVQETLSRVNDQIASQLRLMDVDAVGLESKLHGIIKARKKKGLAKDAGLLGEVEGISTKPIEKVIGQDGVPVISPVGIGTNGRLYNVNADDVSAEVSIYMKAKKLILLTDVKGITSDKSGSGSLFSRLTVSQVHELLKRKVIQEGMIPKVLACIRALEGGVEKAHIIDGRMPHSLILEILTDAGVGTEIIRD